MEKEYTRASFHSCVFAWFLDLVNESQFIGYIIWYQSKKIAERGRGRTGLPKMHRDMKNLQRQVLDLTNMMTSKRIIKI